MSTPRKTTSRKTTRNAARKKTKKKKTTRRSASNTAVDLSIEEAWRYVDRFCRALWIERISDDPPETLANAITTLRDQEIIPGHEAGMMHTIRTLRNILVHEQHCFGEQETTIARAAWEIVRRWAEAQERRTWRATLERCA